MSTEELTFDQIRDALFFAFPEVWPRVESTFGSYYNFEMETPQAYPVFEDVVKKLLFELLDGGENSALLARLFLFFEAMANSPDENVSRDLLGITILEPLVGRGESIRKAWPYMGGRTKELARLEAVSQGKSNIVPAV
ncbi:MAG: hypothetical protein WBE13_15865 [Candidatus Acidiferrum sp.]